MSIVKERIVLRRRRREGEKMPHRIKLDAVWKGDSLLVEIVVGKDENLITGIYSGRPNSPAGGVFRSVKAEMRFIGCPD